MDFSNPLPPIQMPRQGFAIVDAVTGTTLAQRLDGFNNWATRNGDRITRFNERVGDAARAATQSVTQSDAYRAVVDSPFMTYDAFHEFFAF